MTKANLICVECNATLPLKVCQSYAGYYLGYWCNECGPYSRASGYFQTSQQAEEALTNRQSNVEETTGDQS